MIQLDKTNVLKNRNDAILEHKQGIIRLDNCPRFRYFDINTNIVGSKPESYSAKIFSKLHRMAMMMS